MSLQYIIDGYNLVRHASFYPASKFKDARAGLINFIQTSRICGSARNKVTVVFDGFAGTFQQSPGDIDVVFSGEQSADDKIKRLIQAGVNPRTIIVVTDDREIRDFVRLHGIRVQGIEEFLLPQAKKRALRQVQSSAPEISYTQMRKINKELEDIWLNRTKKP